MADERAFEDRIADAVSACVDTVSELAADPYFREAVMKTAVREFSWAILAKFPDKYGLAEQLEVMADVIKNHEDEATTAE
ncbi:hypothetical protein [Roseomonas genomospecies 6]|uniref:Uncharacterized protein n=1 Tax=Roseomonas genomospecies 6 TaxID=214106 RepID=A0A9W7NLG0_9PROT|nr:hypothetical protein [Roseomonas genomospecies 6]KAA0682220.1 hypothetical protein DS843_06650 [Roseomonas genomospecies 6]